MLYNDFYRESNSLSVIKSVSIMVVVAFHAYGMMYANHFPAVSEAYREMYFDLNQYVLIDIAMVAFTFCSGFLFKYLLTINKYSTWRKLLSKKAVRILLPYFVFSLLFQITTNSFDLMAIIRGNGFQHLWYLPMLFWCFIISYAIEKYYGGGILTMLVVLAIAAFTASTQGKLYDINIPFLNMTGWLRWFIWFYLGEMCFQHSEIIRQKIDEFYLVYPLSAYYIFVTCFYPTIYADFTWYSISAMGAIMVVIWYLTMKVDWNRYIIGRYLIYLALFNFGVYIFHYWIQGFLISNTAKRILHLDQLASEHMVLFPLCFFIVSYIVSIMVTMIFYKFKLERKLL